MDNLRFTNKRNIFLLILLTLLFFPFTAQALVVQFHGEAKVNERIVKLGDIADITPSSEQASIWKAREVSRAPKPGDRKIISSQSVINELSRIHGTGNIKWQGAENITVIRKAIIIDRQKIETIIAGFLQENLFRLPEAAVRFKIARVPAQLILPTGKLKYQVIPSNQEIVGSSSFSIIFSVNGQVVENSTVRGKLELITQVVTASQRIRKGDIITPKHIKLTKMDISRIESPYRLPRQVIGMQAKRTIISGRALTSRNLEAPPVVRRGELVRLIAQNGQMQITTTAIAIMDGRPGDPIRVRNIQSDKIIHGRVYAPGVVTVMF